MIKNSLKFLKTIKGGISFTIILMLVNALISILLSIETPLFKELLLTKEIKYLVLWLIVGTGILLFIPLEFYTKGRIRTNISHKLRCKSMDNIINSKISELEELPNSEINTCLSGVDSMVSSVTWIPSLAAKMIFGFSTAVIMLALQNLKLTLLILLFCIPVSILYFIMCRKLEKNEIDKRKYKSRLAIQNQRLINFKLIKSFVAEKRELDQYTKFSQEYVDSTITGRNYMLIVGLLTNLLWYGSTIIIIIVAFIEKLDIATVMVFISLIGRITGPLTNLSDLFESLTEANAEIIKYFELNNLEREYDGNIEMTQFSNKIEFDNVSFSYEKDIDVLKDISCSIEKGKHIGIYGFSGSGKSTFVSLLTRFFKVSSGTITIDNIDINEFSSKSLRNRIGIVSQDVELFSSTIRENIIYGNPKATENEIVEACKKANIYDFIKQLPNGLDTEVGERGVKLSGGEAQRISIARIFLSNPEIIILDEATSKLDNYSELEVQKAIDELGKNKTVIAIAHRLSTIENSDILIGIQSHKIYEIGPAEEIKSNSNSLWNHLYKECR